MAWVSSGVSRLLQVERLRASGGMGVTDLLGLLVEDWSKDSGGSVVGSFQNPTFLSPQCETTLNLLGGLKGVKEPHLEEGREAWGGVWSLCLAGHPLLSSLLFPLSLCIQTLKLAGGFPGRRLL